MDLVLINSPLFRRNLSYVETDKIPPIGLGYIATEVINSGFTVELIDSINEKISLPDLIKIITEIKPLFLGVNIFHTNYDIVREFIESIEFETNIIIGGVSTSSLYPYIFRWKTTNNLSIVIGDGERIILKLLKNEVSSTDIAEVFENKRLILVDKKSDSFVSNVSDVELDRSLFKFEPQMNYWGDYEVGIITGRGCIYNCSFCSAARSINLNFPVRERTVESVSAEIKKLKQTYPHLTSIRILDDIFLKNEQSITKAAGIFSDFNLKWRAMGHVKTFTRLSEMHFISLKNSGCKELFIGIESGASNILSAMNKTSDVKIIVNNLTNILRHGINVKGYFMFGFPNETEEDMELTFNLVVTLKEIAKKCNSNFRASAFQFRPYTGTIIYDSILQKCKKKQLLKLTFNKKLSQAVGRHDFNFKCINLSKVDSNVIDYYICKSNNFTL